MWWLAGQTPQMRVTIRGSSSIGRPTTKRSKPRSSGIWKKQSSTAPSSSRKISILPWPSRRVMGSILIVRVIAGDPPLQQRGGTPKR